MTKVTARGENARQTTGASPPGTPAREYQLSLLVWMRLALAFRSEHLPCRLAIQTSIRAACLSEQPIIIHSMRRCLVRSQFIVGENMRFYTAH